uniref:Uncharacterized protein n=1 Tax=Candidatus Kentrum sp. MB TaxID=2138164 RepID=A0A450XD65_9GAMM|nr:MAG: hypothetical protein BECKMB1821G_GA0114241_102611 [Candidatus Kentron sp. MB]VFK31040.1 MAG: hypothetical protein BECKMB1821I_GA0114274_102012 [Candidatus Kentron sp. MB]VFK75494.1 MAG: hypothetical protein BECKMB1821H_GA0114242_102411 [Candidatus Kentron sp. MB]
MLYPAVCPSCGDVVPSGLMPAESPGDPVCAEVGIEVPGSDGKEARGAFACQGCLPLFRKLSIPFWASSSIMLSAITRLAYAYAAFWSWANC